MMYCILVPLDGSSLAEAAVPIAADIARRSNGSIRLVRVHVPMVPLVAVGDLSAPIYDPAWDENLRANAADYLNATSARFRNATPKPMSTVVRENTSIATQIDECAREFDADLIVMTTHGHGGKSLEWFGSVADGVLRHTRCLTLVVPERAAEVPLNLRRILVCFDGSRAAEATLHAAAKLATLFGAEMTLAQVVSPPLSGDVLRALSAEGLDRFGVDLVVQSAKDALDNTARQLRALGHTVSTTVLVNTNAARALLEHIGATSPDLVAMGTHGRGLSRLFIGSVADKVLRGSGKPALVQRVPEDAH